MKKTLLFICLLIMGTFAAQAQRFALIDMEYIFNKIPEYKQANSQLEQKSKQWQGEVEALSKQAKSLYEEYKSTTAKLTADQRVEKEKQIVNTEKRAAELRRQYFGPNGEAFKLREKLIKPIQDRIYQAVKVLAEANQIYAVVDRASAGSLIYASPEIDISDSVLKSLGY